MKSAEFREQKAGRKAARQQVEALFTVIVRKRQPWLRSNAVRAAVKVMTDRYYADIIRPAAARIEQALNAEAQRRAQAAGG